MSDSGANNSTDPEAVKTLHVLIHIPCNNAPKFRAAANEFTGSSAQQSLRWQSMLIVLDHVKPGSPGLVGVHANTLPRLKRVDDFF